MSPLFGVREALVEAGLEREWCSVKTLGARLHCHADYAGFLIRRIGARRIVFKRAWGHGFEYRILPRAVNVRLT